MNKLVLRALWVGSLVGLASACSGPTLPIDDGGGNDVTLPGNYDKTSCTVDGHCPVGFICQAGTCRPEFPDDDGDGFTTATDCDDARSNVNPDAAEVCNEIDDDCDGLIDEGVANSCGFCGPDPIEVCDLQDNNCNGLVDDDCVGGEVPELEPNNGTGQCQEIALPVVLDDVVVLTGTFDPAGDLDSYCFTVAAGVALKFDMDSVVLGAPTDGRIKLYNQDTGAALPNGENDFYNGYDPYLEYTFSFDGRVRLDVSNTEALGGVDFIYELKIIANSTPGACDDVDGDLVGPCDGDCDESNPLIFPAQTEVCDGIDNNCDAVVDEGCPVDTLQEKEPNETVQTCNMLPLPAVVSGTISVAGDDDTFCFFAPKGATLGFDIDAKEPPYVSNLDSVLQLMELSGVQISINNDGVDPETGYTAVGSDSYIQHSFLRAGVYAVRVRDFSVAAGSATHTYLLTIDYRVPMECVDNDGDGVTTCEGDCDDSDPRTYYGAVELCDLRDNNCDNVGDPVACSDDADGDGFRGTPLPGQQGDCDDFNPFINPNAIEICDDRDNDCDGQIDEGVRNSCGTCGYPPPEVCGNGIDDDCDGIIDTDCNDDLDGDGVTPDQGDCDDTRDDVNPSAEEVCDLIDNDCDGLVDENVRNACGTCNPPRDELVELCNEIDDNCNGLVDEGVRNDCGFCGPAPLEVCDGIDNNCNAEIDEGLTNACGTCGPVPKEACDGLDNDCDGIIDEGCEIDLDGDGFTPREGDCDETDTSTYATAPELCDGKDNDCNGFVDDDYVTCGYPSESEPNNTPATCDTIQWPIVVRGVISDLADKDYYCFTVPPDTTLGFDIDALALNSPLNTYLELWNLAKVSQAKNDDSPAPGETTPSTTDSYISHHFEDGGTFVLEVRPTVNGIAGPNPFYHLTILPENGCHDLDRDGVMSCDNDCNDYNAAIGPGVIDICDGIDNNCSGTADERCVGTCLDDLKEQNDSVASAAPVAEGFTTGLQFCGGDPDNYSFAITEQGTLFIDLDFPLTDPPQDPPMDPEVQVTLLAPNGFSVVAASPPGQATISVHLVTPGTYFINVAGALTVETPYSMLVSFTEGPPTGTGGSGGAGGGTGGAGGGIGGSGGGIGGSGGGTGGSGGGTGGSGGGTGGSGGGTGGTGASAGSGGTGGSGGGTAGTGG